MADIRTSSQMAVQRFICGGSCFWRMPTKEEIEHDFATPPPTQQTEFVGTEDEAWVAGWRLAPREKCFWWRGMYFPLYLCPDCAEKAYMKGLILNGQSVNHYQIVIPRGDVVQGVRSVAEKSFVEIFSDEAQTHVIETWLFDEENMVRFKDVVRIDRAEMVIYG